MADRFAPVGFFTHMARACSLGMMLCGALVLSGCQTMTMPDMSDFKLNIFEEKPVVAIKSGYSKVNIRPTPSTLQAPVAALKGGDKLQLLGEQGDWLNVGFYDTAGNEQVGWVYKYLVEGFDKPVETGAAPSGVSKGTVVMEAPEPKALEVEPQTNEQVLPKSESVSPL